MTTTIFVATENTGKLKEYQAMMEPLGLKAIHPGAIGEMLHVEESGSTFFENALIKARAYAEVTDLPILADDSGLCVDALDGGPGIRSKRLTPDENDDENNRELLRLMQDQPNRSAHFHCSLVYLDEERAVHHFVGRLDGRIANKPRGTHGFGYDPLFLFDHGNKTLAELPVDEKNKHTHRFRALRQWQLYMGYQS